MTSPAIEIRREEITSAAAQSLILALNEELSAQYPEAGATHFQLDADDVREDRGAFLVAYVHDEPLACGAIRRLNADRAEIKRMFVRREARGRGLSRVILTALEAEARRLGVKQIVLETGTRQTEALALYDSSGYARIPPYGEYTGPLSVCMSKEIGS